MTEDWLSGCYSDQLPQKGLADAMRYSLLAGGKRLRPVLALAFCRAFGGDEHAALPAACALEFLHTYSLIHDDLPAMDNDDLRRGKPTNHVVYGECTAILAGDTLQAEAFGLILRAPLPVEMRVKCAEFLADAAGYAGICGGQYLDTVLWLDSDSAEKLTTIAELKTASLLSAACRIGAVLGGADEFGIQAAEDYGMALGMAFQIRDDMLDELSTTEKLGKPIGSDRRGGKSTFMNIFGAARCEAFVSKYTEKAKRSIDGVLPHPGFLLRLADSLVLREH
ncbi:MAG: polyprenyl synthetase family protein [Eubacteriales bacterium]|nr:polyprenyl synthetase family protein [Eubacteriales bacterium]